MARYHPVKKFYDMGIMVCINTDDPVFFKTTMLDELWICYKSLKFSMDEIKELVKNSFRSSFLSEDEKKKALAAAANTRDDLHQTVFSSVDELLQIMISLDYLIQIAALHSLETQCLLWPTFNRIIPPYPFKSNIRLKLSAKKQ